jgi:hypothetical protein
VPAAHPTQTRGPDVQEQTDTAYAPAGQPAAFAEELTPCHSPHCERVTTVRAHYCCVPCKVAAERAHRPQPAQRHASACELANECGCFP